MQMYLIPNLHKAQIERTILHTQKKGLLQEQLCISYVVYLMKLSVSQITQHRMIG
jgi:hypothetical protein